MPIAKVHVWTKVRACVIQPKQRQGICWLKKKSINPLSHRLDEVVEASLED